MLPVSELQKILIRHLPRRHFSQLLLRWSRLHLPGPVNRLQNAAFAKLARIDVSEAEWQLAQYPTLNAFFTRRLQAEARPVDADEASVVFPSDGRLGAFGPIEGDTLIQAKGIDYTLNQLLLDAELVERFRDGRFFTIYLSPKDYHRVHFPVFGTVVRYRHIPGHSGTSYPVGKFCTQKIDKLYCRNERLISVLDTPHGPVAVVMIAACGVGNMTLSYLSTHFSQKTRLTDHGQDVHVPVAKGDECGIFHMGSTVILLFGKGSWDFARADEGRFVRMGRPMGSV
ncbi:phosphatidylserine decarboxylase [Myxococcota bacterium]|nr:phosphatidylserine decarboxylase [Myxococcota bacterium]